MCGDCAVGVEGDHGVGVGIVEGGQDLLLHRGHARGGLEGGSGQGGDLVVELTMGCGAAAQGGARRIHAQGLRDDLRTRALRILFRSATVVPTDLSDSPASSSGP